MTNSGYKLTLLTFCIALISGFYMRLPLQDNLIRSLVIYLVISALFLAGNLLINKLSLDSARMKNAGAKKKAKDEMKQATPNMAK
jgi:hypothetical protein